MALGGTPKGKDFWETFALSQSPWLAILHVPTGRSKSYRPYGLLQQFDTS
jgi:hypothetical protein